MGSIARYPHVVIELTYKEHPMCRHVALLTFALGAVGVGESAPHATGVARLAFGTILRQVGKDKARAEEAVRASDLEWTVVYPPALTNGRATGDYRHGESLKLSGAPRISRADVADFMLA